MAADAFTLDVALAMADDLIAEYRRPTFQTPYRQALDECLSNPVKASQTREAYCLPIQMPIAEKYGFKPSRAGVGKAFGAYDQFSCVPSIAQRNMTLKSLIDPAWHVAQKTGEVIPTPISDKHLTKLLRQFLKDGWANIEKLGVEQTLLDKVYSELEKVGGEFEKGKMLTNDSAFKADDRFMLDLEPLRYRADASGLIRLAKQLAEIAGIFTFQYNEECRHDESRFAVNVRGVHRPMVQRFSPGRYCLPHIPVGTAEGSLLTIVYYMNPMGRIARKLPAELHVHPGAAPQDMIANNVQAEDSKCVLPEEDSVFIFQGDTLAHEIEVDDGNRYALVLHLHGPIRSQAAGKRIFFCGKPLDNKNDH